MNTKFAHYIVSNFPWTYDLLRRLLGFKNLQVWLSQYTANLHNQRILDIGAANGEISLPILPPSISYCWLELEITEFANFKAKFPEYLEKSDFVIADVAHLCFECKSFDTALLFAVAHHLPDDIFPSALAEIARVTKNKFILFEPQLRPQSLISRLLWRYDRGRYPKDIDHLRSAISECFHIVEENYFSIYNNYVVFVAEPIARKENSV